MNRTTNSCPIVLACDEGYAMPLATTMRSIVEANAGHWPTPFYVLSDGFRKKTMQRVMDSLPEGSACVEWLTVSLEPFRGMVTIAHISAMTYARFLLSDLLPPTVHRVLYLDADLLVLGDLEPLCNTPLDECCIGAVTDHGLDSLVKRRDSKCAGMPQVRDYFNAGVLLIDLDRWREARIGEKAMQYLIEHPHTPFCDQDALNAVLDGAWKQLDSTWNFQRHLHTRLRELTAEDRPKIVHFITAAKPWNPEIPNLNAAFYDAFRQRTRFARTPGSNARDAFRKLWFVLKRLLKRQALVQTVWAHAHRRKWL
ncbi:MAG: glycosyltransferase family 8 protein [Burkholderiales bacterium]|nr:glycosyltransferase family 8 protein [Burkholderiales bacterium]